MGYGIQGKPKSGYKFVSFWLVFNAYVPDKHWKNQESGVAFSTKETCLLSSTYHTCLFTKFGLIFEHEMHPGTLCCESAEFVAG